MSILQLKDQVINKLKNADEDLLKKIEATIKDYEEDKIVAHTIAGEPLNIKKYKEEVLKGERDIEEGRHYTTKELRKEIEKWKR
ncbi:MAG: hypothetical protein R3353_02685 [Salegentibacter mishustinae]|jgi:predicted transcriptional regulator|nr:hypothetical protein [Salegentibacter mishustinae]|tara:strand:- start:164 stop:415 length:252 start_codon:yes stop_codon:yes gene_type:complete